VTTPTVGQRFKWTGAKLAHCAPFTIVRIGHGPPLPDHCGTYVEYIYDDAKGPTSLGLELFDETAKQLLISGPLEQGAGL
jgi:hypothetical protein